MNMDIILKLQKLNPEKLTELCHMHLSFTLDLHDDAFSALMSTKIESKPKKGLRYFHLWHKDKAVINGLTNLTQESISQIYQIIEYLGRDTSIRHEGIFRKTGSVARQQELRAVLNTGSTVDFDLGLYSVDDCASVLKTFLSELPEPLLLEAHCSVYIQVVDMCKENMILSQQEQIFQRQLKSIRLLFLLLPHENYCLLKYLLLLLSQVKLEERNKMTASSLATVFAPHILCPRKMAPEVFKKKFPGMVKAATFLIENAEKLFEPPTELVQDVSMCLKELRIEGCLNSTETENEPVKTAITFCERPVLNEKVSNDYTHKALAELQTYIESLPNSARKRKLVKKFQNENSGENSGERQRKHIRSRSVGETIKKHLMKNRKKDGLHKGHHHCSYDMLSSSNESKSAKGSVIVKSKSVDSLKLDKSETNKITPMARNLWRASRR